MNRSSLLATDPDADSPVVRSWGYERGIAERFPCSPLGHYRYAAAMVELVSNSSLDDVAHVGIQDPTKDPDYFASLGVALESAQMALRGGVTESMMSLMARVEHAYYRILVALHKFWREHPDLSVKDLQFPWTGTEVDNLEVSKLHNSAFTNVHA